MLGALGTLLFFAITPVFANRAAHLLGSLAANFWRLVLAAVLLAVWAHAFGGGITGGARTWFFLGGVVGFGLGGIAMFQSLPRLGSALSTLIVQCGSAVAAAVLEWLWLGTTLAPLQIASAALALCGVIVGLLPTSLPRISPAQFATGTVWAFVSALGQGAGAVVSRKAFMTAAALHEKVDPGTAAYQRVLGGLVIAALALAVARVAKGGASFPAGSERPARSPLRATPWVAANALTGPVLGVTCYQWALRTTPAGIVQPIVAASPLLTIPFAIALESAPHPRPRYYVGAVLAILGATGLVLLR